MLLPAGSQPRALVDAGVDHVTPLQNCLFPCSIEQPRNMGFVSSTFCADVASPLLVSGQKARVAAMYWQRVSADRPIMSEVETPELSRRYREAEAVLLFAPSNAVF